MVRLSMLGALSLETEGGSLAGAALRRRPLALLAYVAAAPHGVTRDKLLALLWPESDTRHARNCLKQTLFALRRDVAPALFFPGQCTVRIDPAVVRADRWDFERALEQGAVENAVAAYGGPFLDGFHVGHLVEFERWMESERAKLAEGYERALESLAEEAEGNGQRPALIRWRRRLAQHDPLNSRFAAGLIRALVAAGEVPEAVRRAEAHRRLLLDELGALPDTGEYRAFDRLLMELRSGGLDRRSKVRP